MDHETVDVIAVALLDGHRVSLVFSDGSARERDLGPLLTGPAFDAIRSDPAVFAQVTIDPDLGVLHWPSGVDIDAELLRYDDLWEQTLSVNSSG